MDNKDELSKDLYWVHEFVKYAKLYLDVVEKRLDDIEKRANTCQK
jgi:hypothetical protein